MGENRLLRDLRCGGLGFARGRTGAWREKSQLIGLGWVKTEMVDGRREAECLSGPI